ncbi:MAG: type II CRISPR-associated endonuclease Cas1 [Melioribacteraceae bacterium]|nr:type II CRISPR-associated endonuclease Cas1 [Melioribacteraceae bacterium]
MIKRTLNFSNPAYLSKKDNQLTIKFPIKKGEEEKEVITIPIEDIGIVILENPQITISHSLLSTLLENNVAVITSDRTHHPNGLLLNLDGNTLQSEKFNAQINASFPLKKQLWKQTITAKIKNQAALLTNRDVAVRNMKTWARKVRSGDPDNYEARAAAYFWANIFIDIPDFKRGREEAEPNNLLNYGYAILRAIVARSLVGSGLLPTLGIHHHNKYNAYCLADDIMEPYRPFVDSIVVEIVESGEDFSEMSTSIKKQLLSIATVDVTVGDKCGPLMVAMQRTTASLAKCFQGEERKVLYPII